MQKEIGSIGRMGMANPLLLMSVCMILTNIFILILDSITICLNLVSFCLLQALGLRG